MSRIRRAFERARRENRAAFVAYLTAGDPDVESTLALARAVVRAGADVLELGVPFTDPIADGPVLQAAAARALSAGTTLAKVFAIGRRIRSECDAALVLFSYLNPLHRRGVGRAALEARAAGFDGVLVTDLPPEEGRSLAKDFGRAGLETIFLVSPTSTAERMAAAAKLSTGFLYVVSRTGTTGARPGLPKDLEATVRRARRAAASLPVSIGFGIGTPEAARGAAALADGVVVGSALVRAGELAGSGRVRAVGKLARRLAAACRR